MIHQEVFTRRMLPHWYKPGASIFVTYRLADSIPAHLLREWRAMREADLKAPRLDARERAHKLYFKRLDEHLDAVADGPRWLEDRQIARLVRDSLHHHRGTLLDLIAYCVMPNHVQVLFHPLDSEPEALGPLAVIMKSVKGYTSRMANRLLGRTGAFWQDESYDRWVRDEEEMERIINYIAANPVNARMCSTPQDWEWSSANERFLLDGSDATWFPGVAGT